MVKVQQRGLGRGLSALISDTYTQQPEPQAPAKAKPEETKGEGQSPARELAVKSIVPGKFQPRVRFHEDQLQELSASIAKNGMMQPIIVRPMSKGAKDGIYEIVAGERRWRAAAMANLSTVPVIIRELTDQQTLELSIIENVQRADLSALEEAAGYQRLLEEFGYTQEELATAVGKSRSHIANLLRLLALPDDIRAMVEEGKITIGHARALLNVPGASEIAKNVAARGLSVRQTESLARIALTGAAPARRPRAAKPYTPAGPRNPDVVALEETLSGNLGLKVAINDCGQSGEIIIHYDSLTQLDDILRRLGGGL